MTIKKIALSAVAATLVSTAAFAAGSLTLNGGNVGKFSNELISNMSVDFNNTIPLKYTSGIINASASEPGFELKLAAPALIKSSDGNISIIADDNSSVIATFDRYDSTAHSIIFKKESGASISRGVTYKIVSDDNATLGNGAMEITVAKGSKSVNAELIVTDNTGVNVIDDVNTKILDGADQFVMSIDTPFDAQIDASKAFKEFYGTPSTSDSIVYTIANNKGNFIIPATANSVRLDIVADQNLTTYKMTQATTNSPSGTVAAAIPVATAISLSDYNLTATQGTGFDANITNVLTSTLTTDKTGAMSVTTFKATGVVKFNTLFSKTLLDKAKAGAWPIYGYNAQIPNVMGTSNFSTNLKFTNRSTIDTGVYFTLIDQDGTVVTVDSDNDGIASLPAGTTKQYKASDLIAIAKNKAPVSGHAGSIAGFDGTKSISVEVSIPTEPNKVYGFASFKNLGLGQFKDLPIYNSSTMSY